MKAILDNMITTFKSTLDDIVSVGAKSVEEAYNEGFNDGYKKAVEERKWWIIGSGLGGLLIGMALGRR
jgi:hypothetical protein